MVKPIIYILSILAVVLGVFSYLFHNYNKHAHPASVGADGTRPLRVLAYSSLIGAWSAGPAIQKAFEETHAGVQIEWIDGGDSRAMLQKLRGAVNSDEFDVVIGLDQFSIREARAIESWKSPSVAQLNEVTNPDSAVGNMSATIPATQKDFPWNSELPAIDRQRFEWQSFDWAPLTFIIRKGQQPVPKKLSDLSLPEFKGTLAWIDPRSSSVGLQFFAWGMSIAQSEHELEFIRQILPSHHSFSPNWSGAYGLFTKNQTPIAFSYLTSPVYHWKQDGKMDVEPVTMEDPVPFQVEYAAVPSNCRACREGQAFIDFLRSQSAQAILMNQNYMLPIRNDVIKGTLFEKLPHLRLLDPTSFEKIEPQQVIEVWNRLAT